LEFVLHGGRNMYQKIIVAGNLGRDPELKYMQNGDPVCNFSLATNRRWKNAAGEPQEEVCWFSVSVFRGQAEACNQYLSKGRQVIVEGRLRPGPGGGPRIYTRGDGEPGASFEITADVVRFLQGGEPAGAVGGGDKKEDDEIPF
jgi:single-strand DNA-binding protein